MLLDARLWLLIALSVALLFTLEATEEFTEGAWPHLHRPSDDLGAVGTARNLWVGVAGFVLPGLVLTILNLAILIWQDLQYSNTQLLGTIFVVVGWLVFLAMTTDLGGLAAYLEDVGPVAPVTLLMVLAVGDLLLLLTLVDIFPTNLGALLP
ncbi:MAG: hypothetical protein IRY97_07240 [Thermomicrobiaceae bacterium]|nr:hypothetical protein [Thermomicrobiaceae bacterium]